MRTIPQIRERLHELASELGCPELATLAEETKRKFNGRKAPVACVEVTEELAQKVINWAYHHPDETMHSIGSRFGVNQGRVSEILFGKRG